jgi:hypothetical protein
VRQRPRPVDAGLRSPGGVPAPRGGPGPPLPDRPPHRSPGQQARACDPDGGPRRRHQADLQGGGASRRPDHPRRWSARRPRAGHRCLRGGGRQALPGRPVLAGRHGPRPHHPGQGQGRPFPHRRRRRRAVPLPLRLPHPRGLRRHLRRRPRPGRRQAHPRRRPRRQRLRAHPRHRLPRLPPAHRQQLHQRSRPGGERPGRPPDRRLRPLRQLPVPRRRKLRAPAFTSKF